VKPDNAHFAIRAAVRELEGLVAQGIPADKFEAIRTFARRYYQLFVQTESRRLGYALDARFYAMPRPPIDTLRDAWARIDRAAVAAALRRHIHPAALAIVAVAPNGRALADAIAADAPSPIVYDAPKPDEITAEDRTIATYPLRIPRARVHVVPVNEVFR